ncbi:MAG: radical SAM protein [Nitrospira sp.]|nr:radical SAM protein [Nitrospira sp.]MCA9466432.1 radical SAM protein [Nitrospira sp.]MCB9776848.1 radical SAM protein [Nitrospiraceae bacterium]
MPRIVIELTNRCNLSCLHCYDARHAATGDLSLEILHKVIREGKACGIDHLCFTGGEPTLHRHFPDILRDVTEGGYTYSFVTNGMNFPQIYPLLLRYRQGLQGLTFSLDGAREYTHDAIRGKGSFRRVMRAATICAVKDLPFTFNMVLTAKNRDEITEIIRLGSRLGSRGIRFGHLMFNQDSSARGLNLSPQERREAEAEIFGLQASAPIGVGMGPGYYTESLLPPCSPLKLEEFNLNYRGHLTLCCQLSGYAKEDDRGDFVGNLHELTLTEACERFRHRVNRYLADKQATVRKGELSEVDHFPCWYCVKYLFKNVSVEKVAPLSWNQSDGQILVNPIHV